MVAKVVAKGVTGATPIAARLPQANDMIARCTIAINGIQVCGANGAYGDSMAMVALTEQDFSRSQSVDATLSNGNISAGTGDQTSTLVWHDFQNIFSRPIFGGRRRTISIEFISGRRSLVTAQVDRL